MAGRHSSSPDWRWKLAAWMGETLRPLCGKGKYFAGRLWPELDKVSEGRASPSVGLERLSSSQDSSHCVFFFFF